MKKISSKIKLFTIAVAMLASSVLAPMSSTLAMEVSNHFSVGPMSQKIILTPGETYRGTVSVTNPNSATAPFYYLAQPAPFTVTSEDYDTDFGKETNYTQMYKWMTIENPEGSVEPNNSEDIRFSITVPMDAPAGGQYAAIRVANNKNKFLEDSKENSLNINEQLEIVSVIYASVAGNTRETGNVLENNIPSFILNSPLSASSLVENTGNVHDDAEYILQVYPLFSDEEIYTNEEDPLTKTIMPETKRLVTQEWDTSSTIGIFKAKQTIKIFDQTSTTEKIVVVCPLWLLFVILFVIIAIIIWIIMKVKSGKKARKK